MTKRPTTTIRAVLEMLGGADYVEMDSFIREHDLDTPMIAQFCVDKGSGPGSGGVEHRGEIFVYCSGKALVGFYDPRPVALRRPLYLVLDDCAHNAWNVRARDAQKLPYEQRPDLGPCPRERLRLVQSA